MAPLKEAIQEFKNRRLHVYKADPGQIVRDTRAAERASKDHVGRWLFELLQNSDDAGASEVQIVMDEGTIYVADNGHGLKPVAVSAICGTDFSDKTTGTIGRKGVGFKSVYEVSQNPQVLTVGGEGIEFSPKETKSWLRGNSLNEDDVPYQWIPHFISWDAAKKQDPKLKQFGDRFKTVVRLLGVSEDKKPKVEQLLKAWPPHCLFAFRHLRKITAPGLAVELTVGDGVWSLRDSRGQTPVDWRVAKHTEFPPDDLLQILGKDERRAISTDGVSFLIAAPLENGRAVPTSEYLPIHVFYPTEQMGPVPLLFHAEFLVKSDRTAILSMGDNPFNAWVADRLAYHVCKFVNDAYHPEAPSRHAALLVPFSDKNSHPVAESLWRRVADEAKKCLKLADVEGCQRLSLEKARLVSVSVRPDLARTLLEATRFRRQLLHGGFDGDKKARDALRELGCKEIHDQDLMEAIAKNAGSLAANTQWLWACWEWLAGWVAKEPYGEEHRKRIERAKALPVVPVDGGLAKASELADRIVTWKPDAAVGDLPDWLPLTFVADWFRDKIRVEPEESPVKKLIEKLEIEEPTEDVIQRAVGLAIEQYWKGKAGKPERFVRFILDQDWHETSVASESLKRCPVPLLRRVQGKKWAEAGRAYFGRKWGNDLLAQLYHGVTAVAWVASDGTATIDRDKWRRVLEWLGVANCPRIMDECKDILVWQLPEGCDQWKQYLDTERDYCGRPVEWIATVSQMDHLVIANLDVDRGALLVRLVARHWEEYYRNLSEVEAKGRLSRELNYRSWQVKAKWWWEICETLPLPQRGENKDHIALTKLWLPDKRTDRAIDDLLPVVDLDVFWNDKDVVRDWLINAVGLRTRMEQLTVEEWKELLNHIPDRVPMKRLQSDGRLQDKVTNWYAACLETVAEQEGVSQKAFASCPLLCRKEDVWKYIAGEPRYLEDDNDFATAFDKDVWLFHIHTRLATYAEKYFGVLPLSKSVKDNVTPGDPQSELLDELNVRFSTSLPYVWAWRSSQIKQDAEKIRARLKALKVLVVPTLKANLSLGTVHHKVDRPWHVDGDMLYLHKNHVNEAELAQALAKALGVRAEADFYENLLRCTDDSQRKQKLLSKGIAGPEIARCLREYSGPLAQEEHDEGPEKPTKGEPRSNNEIGPPQPPPRLADQAGDTLEKLSEQQGPGKPPLRIKDPSKARYVLGTSPKEEEDEHIGGGGGGGGTGQGGRSLTEAEKAELEKAGRAFAVRALRNLGYSVKEMSQDNPGYDVLAEKDGDELRVEVKAHSGHRTVVELTAREYREYVGQQGYRWELWNVEYLAGDDSYSVVITPYYQIPDDALDARTFRVDLKKCQRRLQD